MTIDNSSENGNLWTNYWNCIIYDHRLFILHFHKAHESEDKANLNLEAISLMIHVALTAAVPTETASTQLFWCWQQMYTCNEISFLSSTES